jgi:hypothetical protein
LLTMTVTGPQSLVQVSSVAAGMILTRSRGAPACCSQLRASSGAGAASSTASKRVMALINSTYTRRTSGSRGAQSLASWGHAKSMPSCSSHSAGRRIAMDIVSGSFNKYIGGSIAVNLSIRKGFSLDFLCPFG